MIFVKFLLLAVQASVLIIHTIASPIRSPPAEGAKPQQNTGSIQSHGRNGSYHHGPDVCSSSIHARSKISNPANEAADAWGKDHICAPMKYWRLTPDTMRDSGAQAFFLDWFDEYKSGKYQDECDDTQLTAIQCFASMWWGDYDFKCTVDQIERCSAPTAHSIAKWIQGRYAWPAPRVTETARKVYFIYKHFQVAISDLKSDWVS
jgi:hypothetical protein